VDILGRRALIQVALLAALVIWAYWNPIRQTLVTRWIHDPDWGHGWLVPLFSLYFLHAHRTMLIGVRRETNYLGLALMVLFIGAYASSYLWYTITIARPFYMLATAFSAVLFLGGWGVVRLVWFPIAFLIFAVPIPEHIYVDMTMPLRKIASEIGGYVLPVILPGLHAEVQGVVIEYSYNGTPGVLNVEQACSGMRLMMAFVTLGVAMAYLGDRPLWQRLVMVACCVPIAVFCNIIRVTITGFLHIMKDEPLGKAWDFEALSRGTPHALLGIFMLPIAFGLFALVSWILSNLFVEEASADPVAKERPA
jgi:exosortase